MSPVKSTRATEKKIVICRRCLGHRDDCDGATCNLAPGVSP